MVDIFLSISKHTPCKSHASGFPHVRRVTDAIFFLVSGKGHGWAYPSCSGKPCRRPASYAPKLLTTLRQIAQSPIILEQIPTDRRAKCEMAHTYLLGSRGIIIAAQRRLATVYSLGSTRVLRDKTL